MEAEHVQGVPRAPLRGEANWETGSQHEDYWSNIFFKFLNRVRNIFDFISIFLSQHKYPASLSIEI